ncbi:ELIC (plasmid) [Legionella adelaidensis]|uniref:Cys-loop ligand-gated ion channel n=1 Tax=Legionella adelaidensis TaxID=45056 RepID=A0A0W0R5I7_9GAMM|nr:hypothetical protein [Legionella adelaidensis]KTC66284.1 Cys-loop ligand-gated ion channel [Legionella adelaidensis]VEH84880.1 ELIC [Legionella adelaidensis]
MSKKLLFLLLCLVTCYSFAQTVREVGIAINVNNVNAIYPQEEVADLELSVHMRWQADSPSNHSEYYQGPAVDEILKKIWWPYYQILELRGKINPQLKSLTISPTGQVDYLETFNIQIETPMDLHQFPFDKQMIPIRITPFGYSPFEQKYFILSEKIQKYVHDNLDEWQIIGEEHTLGDRQNKPVYNLNVQFERRSGFYLYKVIIPLLIIIAISHGVLWLPYQPAINRLSLVLTGLLTLVAFQWAVSREVPSVSYITLFQAFLLFTYFLVGSKALIIVLGELWDKKYLKKITDFARWFYPIMLILGLLIIGVVYFEL